MTKRVQRAFFTIPTIALAKALLGCILVRETAAGTMAGIISETEAYTEDDPASHAYDGRRTKRNEMMFADGGHAYVYTSYGIHHCLNIVSERKGTGCAVLIRAVTPTEGIAHMRDNRNNKADTTLTNGPGKLCQAFKITLADNGTDITDKTAPLYILPRQQQTTPINIKATPRIGITKATTKQWRFLLG